MTKQGGGLPRRRLLAGGLVVLGAGAASVAGLDAWRPARAYPADSHDALREKWRNVLTGGRDFDPSAPGVRSAIDRIDLSAQQYLDTLQRGSDRTFLWEDLNFVGEPLDQSIHIRLSYGRLRQLALAYSTVGSRFEGDQDLAPVIIDALDWMYEHKYNENVEQYGNWYNWEIGTPRRLVDITTMLFDELSPDQTDNYMTAVERWCPVPDQTHTNLIWRCRIIAVRGAIVGSGEKLELARDAIGSVLEYTTSGNGFYEDGSYIFHTKQVSTGTYGLGLLDALSRLLYLLNGSPWQVTDPNVGNVVHWVREGFAPWLYKGSFISAVRSRARSRRTQQDHAVGHDAARAIMWASQIAEPSQRADLLGLVKHTILADTFYDFFANTNDLASIVTAKDLIDDESIAPRPPEVRNKQYPRMDRVAHRQPGFAFAVSMHSSRVATFESLNRENLRAWFTADGAHYLYNDDLAHYDDDYWATVDPYRLPGTTVPVADRGDDCKSHGCVPGRNYRSPYDWVGGAALDEVGATGMEFQTFDDQQLRSFRLRLSCDGQSVTTAWSPDGTRWVEVGNPARIDSFTQPYIGIYAACGPTDAPAIEAHFESFDVTCDDGCSNASDDFSGDTLDRSRWTRILREDPSRYRLEDGRLILLTDRGKFNTAESVRNVVLQPMPAGRWQAQTTVRFLPQDPYQQVGILVYQDERNLVRLQRVKGSGPVRFTFLEERNGEKAQQVHSFPRDEFSADELMATPHGRKSWFMIKNKVVAVGAGISATRGDVVETTIENRKLNPAGTNRLVINGTEQGRTLGWRRSFEDARWAHLKGSASSADIGYVFPGGTRLEALRENRAGSWSDINQNPSHIDDEVVERPYLTMWLDHGVDPDNADYAWILLPGASADEVRSYAQRPNIEIISNTPTVQAVRAGGTMAANFWTAEQTTVNDVTCDGQASLVMQQTGHRLTIAVSDPTHLNDRIKLQVRRRAARVISHDQRIRVNALSPAIIMTIDVAGAAGDTVRATFDLSES